MHPAVLAAGRQLFDHLTAKLAFNSSRVKSFEAGVVVERDGAAVWGQW